LSTKPSLCIKGNSNAMLLVQIVEQQGTKSISEIT
jgi:hypothetical protein